MYSTICVNLCIEKLTKLGVSLNDDQFYLEKFYSDGILGLEAEVINGTNYYRETYGKIINKCININLWEKYGLEGYTEINFCSNNKETLPFG